LFTDCYPKLAAFVPPVRPIQAAAGAFPSDLRLQQPADFTSKNKYLIYGLRQVTGYQQNAPALGRGIGAFRGL
jgi:hypothetical protein